jgi:chromosomal replication initiator protein
MAHDVVLDVELAEQIRTQACLRIEEDRMQLWFGANARWSFDPESGLRVTVASEFLADCIRSFCRKELLAAIAEVAGSPFAVHILHDERLETASTETDDVAAPKEGDGGVTVSPVTPIGSSAAASVPEKCPAPTQAGATEQRPVYGESTPKPLGRTAEPAQSGLNSKMDYWKSFIESQSNRMAWTAAQMVVEKPGTVTPLLVHGPCGSGKSHLIRGIAQQLRAQHAMRRVLLMTAEQFTIDYTDSARGAGFASFRKKYRDVEALIIDDVQFLLGKHATLLELRNTADNLLRSHRQVVFAADRSLAELVGLGSELHTRLIGGMTCSLEPLDVECRIELLKTLCRNHGIGVGARTVRHLATASSGDARILHGMTFRLLAAQRHSGSELKDDVAIATCADLIRASQPVVRIPDIEKVVCDAFGLAPRCLQEKTKSKGVSQPRMLAMFLARKYTRAAYSEIGEYFGNRQHSTVISAQKKVEDWLNCNEQLDHARGPVGVREMLRNLESLLQVG